MSLVDARESEFEYESDLASLAFSGCLLRSHRSLNGPAVTSADKLPAHFLTEATGIVLILGLDHDMH